MVVRKDYKVGKVMQLLLICGICVLLCDFEWFGCLTGLGASGHCLRKAHVSWQKGLDEEHGGPRKLLLFVIQQGKCRKPAENPGKPRKNWCFVDISAAWCLTVFWLKLFGTLEVSVQTGWLGILDPNAPFGLCLGTMKSTKGQIV